MFGVQFISNRLNIKPAVNTQGVNKTAAIRFSMATDKVSFTGNSLNVLKGALSPEVQAQVNKILNDTSSFKPIGTGVKGIVYRLESSNGPLALKLQRKGISTSFEKEAEILNALPDMMKKKGQKLVAYGKDRNGSDVLITNFVKGTPKNSDGSMLNKDQMNSLFESCIELDRSGIQHGDIGLGNWLIDGKDVNLIDYESSQFFDVAKSKDDCLPPFILPTNMRTFEVEGVSDNLADRLERDSDKKAVSKDIRQFFKDYLEAKSVFHDKRTGLVENILKSAPENEKERISAGLAYEKTMAAALKQPTKGMLEIEALKAQFFHDFAQIGKSHTFNDYNGIQRNWDHAMADAKLMRKAATRQIKALILKEKPTAQDYITQKYLKYQVMHADYFLNTYKSWADGTNAWLKEIVSKPQKQLSDTEKQLVDSYRQSKAGIQQQDGRVDIMKILM